MNILKYHGLDLPIYPTEEVLHTKEQYRSADLHGQSTFVRTVRTSGPTETLASRLSRADWYFDQIARYCGTKIVPHTWGLCKDVPEITFERRLLVDDIVPRGYLPVAEVTAIEPCGDIPLDAVSLFQKGLTKYYKNAVATNEHPYTDVRIGQVMYGRQVASDQEPRTWYVDIEPLVGTQHLGLVDGVAFANATIIHG